MTLTLTSVYEDVAGAGGFSSILNVGGGIVLAGKWHWDAVNYPEDMLFRSYDWGATWGDVGTIAGATGKAVTGLKNNGNVVMAVTGDKGDPCLLTSRDYGDTWSVLLSTADLATLCAWNALDLWSMSVVYCRGYYNVGLGYINGRWFVGVYNDATDETKIIESSDNGLTFTIGITITQEIKRMMETTDRTLLAVMRNGIYTAIRSATGDLTSWVQNQECNAHTLIQLASGTLLAGTEESFDIGTKIFRSTGTGWSIVRGFPPLEQSQGKNTIRAFANSISGETYLWVSGDETDGDFHGCEGYESVNDGLTWTSIGNPHTNVNGGMAGVYDATSLSSGVILLGCTPDANILTSSTIMVEEPILFFDAMLRLAHFLMPVSEDVAVGNIAMPEDGIVYWDIDRKHAIELDSAMADRNGMFSMERGTRYALSNTDYNLAILRRAINEAMREYAQVMGETEIETVENQETYWGANNVKELWISSETTEPRNWMQLFHWDEHRAQLRFPTGYAPSTSGYTLKEVYQQDPDDSVEIPYGVDLDLVHWAACVWAVENSGMPRFHGDPKRDLINKAMKAEAELNKRLRNFRVWQRSPRPADY